MNRIIVAQICLADRMERVKDCSIGLLVLFGVETIIFFALSTLIILYLSRML